jgi:hypothetical protein
LRTTRSHAVNFMTGYSAAFRLARHVDTTAAISAAIRADRRRHAGARSPARVVQGLRDRGVQPETKFKSHNRTLRPVRRFDKHVTGRRPL